MANYSSTEGRATLTISQYPEITNSTSAILENKTTTKPVDGGDGKEATRSATDGGDGKEATGSATNHFISILAIFITFVPFF